MFLSANVPGCSENHVHVYERRYYTSWASIGGPDLGFLLPFTLLRITSEQHSSHVRW